MVKHTKEYLEKHKRLIQKRKEEKRQKLIEREQKKKETSERRKRRRQQRFQDMKKDEHKYKEYLEKQSIYRDIQRKKKNKERQELISQILEGKNYRVVYNEIGNPYYVTDEAEIYNRLGNKIKPYTRKTGYKQVLISQMTKMLHRLVWEAFNGKIPDGMEIDHIIPLKNGGTDKLDNLRMTTHKDNCNNQMSIQNYKEHNRKVDRSYLRHRKRKKDTEKN